MYFRNKSSKSSCYFPCMSYGLHQWTRFPYCVPIKWQTMFGKVTDLHHRNWFGPKEKGYHCPRKKWSECHSSSSGLSVPLIGCYQTHLQISRLKKCPLLPVIFPLKCFLDKNSISLPVSPFLILHNIFKSKSEALRELG